MTSLGDEPPITLYERKILSEPDGHFCADWDFLTVSALTPEYDCCTCSGKSRLGRLLNWLYMFRWNFRDTIRCWRRSHRI
jgi:hypothetical protein